MTRPLPGLLALALAGVVLIGAGCDEKKTTETAPTGDAGASTDKYATADPKLAKALQAAASAAPANENGPPPSGIFAPGIADKRHPKGAPTTVDMVGDGNEPRIALAGGPDAVRTSYGPAVLQVAMVTGQSATPTVALSLVLGPAKKDDGGADWLAADFKQAEPAKEQVGELPPGTDKDIESLVGTQVRVKLSADGAESDVQSQLAKQALRGGLDRIARNAAEALVLASVPVPPKPVGVGGQWIGETRMPLGSLDVIAYRAFKVTSIDGNRIHLTFDLKAYAASPTTTLVVPKEATMEQVDAEGQGELELVRGEVLARKSNLQLRVVMMFQASGGPQEQPDPSSPDPGQPPGKRMLTAPMQVQAIFVRGDDLRAALRP